MGDIGGFQIFLKPLLFLTDYENIRIINGVIQVLLVGLLSALLIYRKKKAYVLPILITYAFLMPPVLAKSLQYSTSFYLMIIGALFVVELSRHRVNERINFSFFMELGILTAFFDFWTYPIVTYCIPAILYLCLADENNSTKKSVLTIIRTGIAWVIGYGGMWASKWFVGSLLSGTNLLSTALSQVVVRSALGEAEEATLEYILMTFKRNYWQFINTPMVILVILYIVFTLIIFVSKLIRNTKAVKINWMQIVVPHMIIAALPLVWYACMSNHSYLHDFYTYKALVASVFSGMTMVLRLTFYNNTIGKLHFTNL